MINSWTPEPEDIEWTKRLIDSLCDGGCWAVPASLSIYTFNKKQKEYTLVGDCTHCCNQRIMKVLTQLGYSLKQNVN